MSEGAHFRQTVAGQPDASHTAILYLEDLNVSFDGFKAINNLTLRSNKANFSDYSDRTARAKPPSSAYSQV